MLANIRFRTMTPAERGLLYTMRLECWVNHGVPKDAVTLAKVLGFSQSEVATALPAVAQFFGEANGLFISPELEDYRAHLAGIRVKQAAGGKKGAEKTNGKHKSSGTTAAQGIQADSGNSQLPRDSTCESLVQFSPVQSNPTQPIERDVSGDGWLNDYDKASNGS